MRVPSFLPSTIGRLRLPLAIARLRVEGGAPYLDACGIPQYDPDQCDSRRTYPWNDLAEAIASRSHAVCELELEAESWPERLPYGLHEKLSLATEDLARCRREFTSQRANACIGD